MALAVVAAAVGMVGASPVPAEAAINQVSCLGTEGTTFSPGITNTPQTITITVTNIEAPCLSLSDLSLRSGYAKSTRVVPGLTCLTLLAGGGEDSMKFTWNTGNTSTFKFQPIVNFVAGNPVVVQNGLISEGQFVGSTAKGTVALVADLTQCSQPTGVTSATGLHTFNILL